MLLELEKVLIEAIMRLDIEMFKEFYIHTEDYKNSKRLFLLRDLKITMDNFKSFGDTHLVNNQGTCERCNKGCYGFQLVGNNSKNYLSLLVDKNEENVVGIIECSKLVPLVKIDGIGKRIYLHEFNDPDSPNNVPF